MAAGLAVFGERGYQTNSITDLCRAAGSARSQFYEHFENREALLVALYDMVQVDARQAVSRALAGIDHVDILERVRVAVEEFARAIGGDPRRADLFRRGCRRQRRDPHPPGRTA